MTWHNQESTLPIMNIWQKPPPVTMPQVGRPEHDVGLGILVPLAGLSQIEEEEVIDLYDLPTEEQVERRRRWQMFYQAAGVAGVGVGAYHGFKRNDSVGWAIGWALLGGLFPIIVIPVAFAQGFGKRK